MKNLHKQIVARIKRRNADIEKLKKEIESCSIGYINADKFLRLSRNKDKLEVIIDTLEEVKCDIELKLSEK